VVVSRGPSDVIRHEDLLQRLLQDYGLKEYGETARSEFVDGHIQALESSDNEVIARTGFVLKRAADGFGLGYKIPLAVVAMGRAMLGIDLAVAVPLLSTNPAAFTCAAAAAVYYGYAALSDNERLQFQTLIAEAFEFGVELVKGVIDFFIVTMRSVFDSDLLKQMKALLAEAATSAGTSLYEITGSLKDRTQALASSAYAGASWLATSRGGVLQSGVVMKLKRITWHKNKGST